MDSGVGDVESQEERQGKTIGRLCLTHRGCGGRRRPMSSVGPVAPATERPSPHRWKIPRTAMRVAPRSAMSPEIMVFTFLRRKSAGFASYVIRLTRKPSKQVEMYISLRAARDSVSVVKRKPSGFPGKDSLSARDIDGVFPRCHRRIPGGENGDVPVTRFGISGRVSAGPPVLPAGRYCPREGAAHGARVTARAPRGSPPPAPHGCSSTPCPPTG